MDVTGIGSFQELATGVRKSLDEVQLVSRPGSAAILAGIPSGTATGLGWTRPERRSPSKRS